MLNELLIGQKYVGSGSGVCRGDHVSSYSSVASSRSVYV